MLSAMFNIKQPLWLAPMDDITDRPFRLICKELGADIVVTEFTSCEALIRSIPKALARIRIRDEERPVGIQIFGANPQSIQRAVQIIEPLNPEMIDINCGCWSKTHAQRGEGAGLLRDLPNLERVVRAAVTATKIPVTVKTRLGWDRETLVIEEVARIVEQCGAQALTVHCRTRVQGYKGQADWTWLPRIKKVISIPLIANGDVTEPEHAKALFDMGCDGVMIGRAAIVNPWIFQATRAFLDTGRHGPPPSPAERLAMCRRHLDLAVLHKGQFWGAQPFRKYFYGYLRGFPSAAKIRGELMQITDLEAVKQRIGQLMDELSAEPAQE